MFIDIMICSTHWDGVLRKETIYGKENQHPADVIQGAIDFLEEIKAKVRGNVKKSDK